MSGEQGHPPGPPAPRKQLLCRSSRATAQLDIASEQPYNRAGCGHAICAVCEARFLSRLKVGAMDNDPEILLGLSSGELEALAEGMLAPSIQARLDDLVARSKEGRLPSEEAAELDLLLSRADQLTLVKTRARYTLRHLQAQVSGS